MQQQHARSGDGKSQCQLILGELLQKVGQWVPMPTLVEVSGSYNVHSRISDLRKAGHGIRQRSSRLGRKVVSYYMLEAGCSQ